MTRFSKVLIPVLVILNVVLLVQNYYLRKNISSSSDKYEELRGELYEFGGKGKLLNPLSYIYNNIEVSPAIKNLQSNSAFLLVVFDDHGCPACIEHQVTKLNNFPDNLKQYVSVIYKGEEKGYLENFKPTFKYSAIAPGDMIFDKPMDYPNPMAFLIADNHIYMLLRTESSSNLKTDLFYERVINLLGKIHSKGN